MAITQKRRNQISYILAKAIRTGQIIKPKSCSLCKSTKRINGHHKDYNKPLEVEWMCQKCHVRFHNGLAWDDENSALRRRVQKKHNPDYRVTFLGNGKRHDLPILKKESYQLNGLLSEEKIVDDHQHKRPEIEKLKEILNSLTFREREIIKLRYGFGDGYEYTQTQIARIFKVTRQRVMQIEAGALTKLRYRIKAIA